MKTIFANGESAQPLLMQNIASKTARTRSTRNRPVSAPSTFRLDLADWQAACRYNGTYNNKKFPKLTFMLVYKCIITYVKVKLRQAGKLDNLTLI